MYTAVFEGIRFIEGSPRGARIIKSVHVEIGGVLTFAQLKNLDDVNSLMTKQCKKAGGNAIVDFKYGQKSVTFWKSFFVRDSVHWYGEGNIAIVR